MNDQVDIAKHPFGLGGGIIISGSAQISLKGFVYYPIQTTSAKLVINNLQNGNNFSSSFTAGIPIYGAITEVTQSSGIAIVYSGSSPIPRY
jgi:hypothetical protein